MRPSIETEFAVQDLPATRGTWKLALFLALTALFAGVMLTGVSAWFLGAVALAGAGPAAFSFNFHVPAAFVRLFALTRTVAKYGERVVGHKAALLDQVRCRSALFSAMAASPTTRRAGWQLADQDRLSDFIDDVEDVDYARLRIGLPVKSLLAALGFLAVATLVLAPLAMLPILLMLAATAILAGRLLPRTRSLWGRVRAERRAAARQFGMALASSVPLRAERRWTEMLDAGFDRLAAAEAGRLSSRRDMAILDTAAGAFGPLAAACVLGTAWALGYRGEALLPAGLLAFAWLGLGETVQGVSRMLVARVKEEEARHGIREWTAGSQLSSGEPSSAPTAVATLELLRMPLVTPDGRLLGGTVHLDLQAGRPVVLAGPSGCGKTSLLKQVAGWLATPRGGQVLGDGVPLEPSARRRLFHLGLHDAAVMADTIRENLFAPDASDRECWDALEAVELDGRVREAGGLDAWLRQDVVSLGEAQRLNLARALLSPLSVILLDEPTEHLDRRQAARIMDRLIDSFSDRILIFSSHDNAMLHGDRRVQLVRLGDPHAPSAARGSPSSAPRRSR